MKKVCNTCKEEKDLKDFKLKKTNECKKCMGRRYKKNFLKHREEDVKNGIRYFDLDDIKITEQWGWKEELRINRN